MSEISGVVERLEALETHAAHQAQVIDDLNEAVAAQWTLIDTLRRHMGDLVERLDTAERPAGSPTDQRPPHY